MAISVYTSELYFIISNRFDPGYYITMGLHARSRQVMVALC